MLAAALSATLMLELLRPFAQASANLAPIVLIPHQPPYKPAPLPNVDGILARPLFASSRRAPAVPVLPAEKIVLAAPPRLTGVILTPSGGRAIVARQASKPVVVSDGDHIGSGIVEAIASDTVLLVGPDGRQVLRMTPDPAARVISHVLRAVDATGH
ncbi:MAG TPA: hypothetical protein VGM42_11435 [Rhodopila sp.]